ncbi:hypothetical protein [Paraburkholderia caribensis]|uniref:hypothetical protein n=1 Tax=Paraburkholderia caribensis TaxID=75105 RepID=UPI00078C4F0A|nr:hypothetical protein [Paraburkholderia caribensis]AMV41765.1 hypothetical protein ATN79_03580 [Paraburkholderia caribensis]
MTYQLTRESLIESLVDETTTLCIHGAWGAGKTHLWREVEKNALPERWKGRIAYASVFGANSLAEIKQRAWLSAAESYINRPLATPTIVRRLRDRYPADFDAVARRIGEFKKRFGEEWTSLMRLFGRTGPLAEANAPYLARVMTSLVTDGFFNQKLVVLDDVERLGKDLSIDALIGWVDYLTQSRQCKVLLILNEDAIQDDQRAAWNRYREKVIDRDVALTVTPAEAVRLASEGIALADFEGVVRDAEALQLTNIRVIKRALAILERLDHKFEIVRRGLERAAASSVVMLTAAHYNAIPGGPDIAYILGRGEFAAFVEAQNDGDEQERKWAALLSRYHWSHVDDFDRAVVKLLDTGLVDVELFDGHFASWERDIQIEGARSRLRTAGNVVHRNFSRTDQEALDALMGLLPDVPLYGLADILNILALLHGLDHDAQAAEFRNQWLELLRRGDIRMSEDGFESSIQSLGNLDEELIARTREVLKSRAELPGLSEVLMSIRRSGGWSERDIVVLRAATVDDYVAMLTTFANDDLHDVLHQCMQWVSNPPDGARESVERFVQACRIVASRSSTNRYALRNLFGRYQVRHLLDEVQDGSGGGQ